MTCNHCGKVGESSLFSKSNVSKDGEKARCKECKRKEDALYRIKNKEKLAEYFTNKWKNDPERRAKNKIMKEKQRFGMNATEYVSDKECEICGINNEQHKEKYGERLHIHHRNNEGRHNIRLNIPTNHSDMQVLCRSCHVSVDNKNRDYTNRGYKIWETRRRNERNKETGCL